MDNFEEEIMSGGKGISSTGSSTQPLSTVDFASKATEEVSITPNTSPAVEGQAIISSSQIDSEKPGFTSVKDRLISTPSTGSNDSDLQNLLLVDDLINALSDSSNEDKDNALFNLGLFKKAESMGEQLDLILLSDALSVSEKRDQLFDKTGFATHMTRTAPPPTKPEDVLGSLKFILNEVQRMIKDEKLLDDPERIIALFASANPCFESQMENFTAVLTGVKAQPLMTEIDRTKTANEIFTSLIQIFCKEPGSTNSDGELLPDKFIRWANEYDGLVGSQLTDGSIINYETIKNFVKIDPLYLFAES